MARPHKLTAIRIVILFLVILLVLSLIGLAVWHSRSRQPVTQSDQSVSAHNSIGGTAALRLLPWLAVTPLAEPDATSDISLYQGHADDNIPFTVNNMLPGDVEVRTFNVAVNHSAPIFLYMYAEATRQTKNLGNVLQIRLTNLDTGTLLYEGPFNEMPRDRIGELLASSEDRVTVSRYQMEVSLPTTAGNEYQQAMLSADLHWYVVKEEDLTPPQTGEKVWIAILLLAALAILFIGVLRTRKKEVAPRE